MKSKKISIVYVYKFLREASNKEHPVSQLTICKALNKLGIECNRKTVARDINCLIDNGFEITKIKGGGCYIKDENMLKNDDYLMIKVAINLLDLPVEEKARLIKKLQSVKNINEK